jgi:hypothetical protein
MVLVGGSALVLARPLNALPWGREFLLLTSKEEQNYGVLGRTERSCASQSRTNESKQEENN